jgi:hypothetical protein
MQTRWLHLITAVIGAACGAGNNETYFFSFEYTFMHRDKR